MTIIKTRDFVLRHAALKDLKGLYETETDPQSKKMFMSFPKSIAESRKDLREAIKNNKAKPLLSETFSIIVQGKYAGYVKLQLQDFDPKKNEGRLHIAINPKFRGKGLATKAFWEVINYGFKKRKFKRIFCQGKAINKPLIHVLKKLGFRVKKVHMVKGIKKILFVLNKRNFKKLK